MNNILSVIIGILSSLTASFVFLFFVSRLRPKIVISDQIATRSGLKGEKVYIIKVINRGRRPLTDIRMRLHLMIPQVVPGGIGVASVEIPFKQDGPMSIAEFNKRDLEANYAHQFVTYEDIEAIWENDTQSYLNFRIFAKDSLSGFGQVFTQHYHTKRNSIVPGFFEMGNSVKIK